MPAQHVDQKIAWLPTTDVRPNPKNRNAHSAEQVKRLAKLIEHYGWRKPLIVSNQSGQLVVGHGRLLAAKLLKAEQVPVVYQDFTPEDEYGFAVADNAIAAWAELDLAGINTDVGELGPDFDIDLLGLDGFTIDPSENGGGAEYTTKICAPTYEPKGDKPPVSALVDTQKTDGLLLEIDQADLSIEIKNFLRLAAGRHNVFDYEHIAEYYAHATKPLQELMEKSALVIIDFDKAVENGFVALSESLGDAYLE